MNILDFQKMKEQGKKITVLTCYDYFSAAILDKTSVNCILVGDSVGMIMHGYTNSIQVSIEDMVIHTKAVARGTSKFIISDMPFFSFRKSLKDTCESVAKLIQAGANAIKIEGADGNKRVIKHLVNSGIPVMGHIGLTAQAINQLGGYKVQGKDPKTAQKLLSQAKLLEDAGCFAIVLECIPYSLAKEITDNISIPTIGIGAGPYTSGQVLVLHDLLGLQTDLKPKFVKNYLAGNDLFKKAIEEFIIDVNISSYPAIPEHSYG